MTDEHQSEPTAEECIRAGMYWFGRSDFVAAEAWWQRAVELEPGNPRAQECLRLLEKTSSTGFKEPHQQPFASPTATRNPTIPPETPISSPSSPSLDSLEIETDPGGMQAQSMLDDSEAPTPAAGLPAQPMPSQPRSTPTPSGLSTDPFDFAAGGEQLYRTPSSLNPPNDAHAPTPNPWDQGPSRTPVVHVNPEGSYDAVPDPTPLPQLDRERFFNRGDPQSKEEIVDFLRATGDLPMDPPPMNAPAASSMPAPPQPGADIVFDDPIELDASPAPTSSPSATPLPTDPAALLAAAKKRYQLHDFMGALEFLDQIEDDEEARALAAEARKNLMKMYESKIGDFDRAPRVLISGEEVIWLNLNHRAGFILSQIDGSVSYEDLIALSGMPRLDTVRILADLISNNVIG